MPTPKGKNRRQQVKAALAKKRAANPKVPLVRQQPAIPEPAPVPTPTPTTDPAILNRVSGGAEKAVRRSIATTPTPTTEGVQLAEQAPQEFGSTFATNRTGIGAVPERQIGEVISGAPRASARQEPVPLVRPAPTMPAATDPAALTPAPAEPTPATPAPAVTPVEAPTALQTPVRPELRQTPSGPALESAVDRFGNLFRQTEAETLQRLREDAAGKESAVESEYQSTISTLEKQVQNDKENLQVQADKELQSRLDTLKANKQLKTDAQGNLLRGSEDLIASVKADIADRLARANRDIDSSFLDDKLKLDVKRQTDLGAARAEISKFELESLGRQRDFLLESAQSELGNEQAIALQQLKGAQELQSMALQGQIDLTTQEQKILQEGAQAMQLQAQGAILDTNQKLAVQEADRIANERLQTIKGTQAAAARAETAAYGQQSELFKAQVKDQFTQRGIQTEDVVDRLKTIASIENPEEAAEAARFLQAELNQAGINYDLGSMIESIGNEDDLRTLDAKYRVAQTAAVDRSQRGGTKKSSESNLSRIQKITSIQNALKKDGKSASFDDISAYIDEGGSVANASVAFGSGDVAASTEEGGGGFLSGIKNFFLDKIRGEQRDPETYDYEAAARNAVLPFSSISAQAAQQTGTGFTGQGSTILSSPITPYVPTEEEISNIAAGKRVEDILNLAQ